jgi:formylglycine-generating enzyme required for sulfatase activity
MGSRNCESPADIPGRREGVAPGAEIMADPTYDLVEPEDEKPQEEKAEPSGLLDEEAAAAPPSTPAPQPVKPLPRLVRFTDPDEEPPRRRTPRKEPEPEPKPAAKGPKPPARVREEPGEKKGVLEEQTPELDTYETRSKIRLALGLGLVAALGLALLFVLRPFLGSGPSGAEGEAGLAAADPVVTGAPPAPNPKAAATAEPAEREARLALDEARGFALKKDADNTLRRLQAVVERYPKSAAAKEAKAALDRGDEGLPLFVDVPLVLARKAEAAPKPEPVPAPVVEVAPAPRPPPGPAQAELAPPLVTPEPRVETGLTLQRADVPPRPLPDGFRARPEAGVHPSGWPLEITCDHDGAAMVLVPGGTFRMGRDDGPPQERPAHKVTVSPYYIDQHEVTLRQYRLFAIATGRKLPAEIESDSQADPALPMVQVSAREAKDYADWCSKSLPTEAQWELAARTTDGRVHPWGPGPPDWGRPRKPGQIDPVMSFPLDLSPYGAFDLAGNAREWTADWYDSRYYQQFLRTVPVDPLGPAKGSSRGASLTIKGGSPTWDCSWRADMRPEARLPDLGFRCVLWLTPKPASAPPAQQAPNAPRTAPGVVPF